jgi:hypothetical protein
MTTLMLEVRELLDRNLNAVEIAHRIHVNLNDVVQAITQLSQMT